MHMPLRLAALRQKPTRITSLHAPFDTKHTEETTALRILSSNPLDTVNKLTGRRR